MAGHNRNSNNNNNNNNNKKMEMMENGGNDPDRVADLFHGRTVFITGASGFLGKVLVEKLLRCCSGIKTIYVLIRNKKGKTPHERMDDIFSNMVFNVLNAQQPDVLKRKCIPIAGDVTEIDLGLTIGDRAKLQNEVDFIFHSAATTRFDDSLQVAAKMNTRGTKYMLDLAGQCKKLMVFVHVSTAYAFPKEDVLLERSYAPPANPHEVLNAINWVNDNSKDQMTKMLLGDCPNTYTFTKALAEALVVEQMDKLPCIIVRPSVVVPTLMEPIPGWCNNLQGPMGLFVGAGKGIIRTMYVSGTSYADFLPVDIVINGMLTATWNFTKFRDERVYHLTSSTDFQITWEEIIEIGKDVVTNEVPFNGIVWYPGGSLKKNRLVHNIAFFFYQIIPALFIDLLLICLGYKPVLYQIQRRIQKGGEMFEYYTTKSWKFNNDRAHDIRSRLNRLEKTKYKIDGEGVDVKKYFIDCIRCVRNNILKETDDMLPAARRNMKIMYVLDIVCKTIIIATLLYYTYKWLF